MNQNTASIAAETPAPDRTLSLVAVRRLNWIRIQRLSPLEASELPLDFDPGPEFDTQEHDR